MARKNLVKLGDDEYQALLQAKELIKQYGISKFSKEAQATIENGSLGSYVHLGSMLIIEHFEGIKTRG